MSAKPKDETKEILAVGFAIPPHDPPSQPHPRPDQRRRAMKILAIDPGPSLSQFVLWDAEAETVLEHGHVQNAVLQDKMAELLPTIGPFVVIEGVACYGMPVGAETFETCIWIGRFQEFWLEQGGKIPALLYRKDVKMNLCQSMKAKDSNIRQALIDRFGPPGVKKAPGKLYGISKHAWAALALAVTFADKQTAQERAGR